LSISTADFLAMDFLAVDFSAVCFSEGLLAMVVILEEMLMRGYCAGRFDRAGAEWSVAC
jgi:membrane protease YdiL (CAAX protease family)